MLLLFFSGSVISDSATPWTAARQASLHHQLLELAQTHVHRVCDAIQPSHPLSSPSPLAFNLSQHQGLFKWVSSSHQVAKVLEYFRFSISLSNEYSGLISFRKWGRKELDTTERLHSPTHSAFFMVQLSHLYITTGKTIALIKQTFVRNVMPLLFNMLSRFVNCYCPIYGLLR